MPLWRIYHPTSLFTADEKSLIAKSITNLYTPLLPAFYVNVLFLPYDPQDGMFIGGQPRDNFVRLVAEHIARNFDNKTERMNAFMQRVTAAVGDILKEKAMDWECHIAETPFDLWTIQGLKPPTPGSEEEEMWKREGKAIPF